MFKFKCTILSIHFRMQFYISCYGNMVVMRCNCNKWQNLKGSCLYIKVSPFFAHFSVKLKWRKKYTFPNCSLFLRNWNWSICPESIECVCIVWLLYVFAYILSYNWKILVGENVGPLRSTWKKGLGFFPRTSE